MKNLKTIMLSLTIVLLSTSFGFSQRGMNGQMNQGEPMFFNVIDDLTQAQKDKIMADKSEMIKKVTPLQAQLNVKKAEMDVLMTKNSSLKEKEVLAKEMSDIKLEIQMARIQHHENVRAILNDDQKVVFDNWTLNHHKGMKKGMRNGNCRQGKMNGQGRMNGQGNGNGPKQGNR